MSTNNLIQPISFDQYEKLTDKIYTIGQNCSLNFNVQLARSFENKRYFFHKEYEYSTKYNNGPSTLVTLKRNYDYYLSIENDMKPDTTDKCFIMIRPQEFYLFKNGITTAINWFQDSKYEKLFQIKDNKIHICPPIPEYSISRLPMGKYLKLVPIVIQIGQSEYDNDVGVYMELSDPSNVVIMNLDRLMGLDYILSTFNMVLSAQTMINYLGTPEYGFNRMVIDGSIRDNKIMGRQIPGLIGRKK